MSSKEAGKNREPREGLHEVIVRLPDALPRRSLENWHHEVERCMSRMRQSKHRELSAPEEAAIANRNVGRIKRYLDESRSEPLLANPQVAEILRNIVEAGNGAAYTVHDLRVMPNYMEIRVELSGQESLETVLQRWKSDSTRQVNAHLGRTGALWHPHVLQRRVAPPGTVLTPHRVTQTC